LPYYEARARERQRQAARETNSERWGSSLGQKFDEATGRAAEEAAAEFDTNQILRAAKPLHDLFEE
jgi:hypothetical protein